MPSPTFRRCAVFPRFLLSFRRCVITRGPLWGLYARFRFQSPLRTFRRCAVFPRFLLTFRRCAIGPGPSVGPVRAFSFPVASSHLPKVCSFPVFSAHLPKVRNRPGTLCRACTRVFVSSRLFPPSEGVQFFRVFCSPSEGAQLARDPL